MDKNFATFYWNPVLARDHLFEMIVDFCSTYDFKNFMKLSSGSDLHFFERCDDPKEYEDELPGITKACEISKAIGTYNDEEPLIQMYDATHHIMRSANMLQNFVFDKNRFVTYAIFNTSILRTLPLDKEEKKSAKENLQKLSPDVEMKEFSSLVDDSMKGMAKKFGINDEELKCVEAEATTMAEKWEKLSLENPAIILAHCKAKAMNQKMAEKATDDPWLSYVVNPNQGIVFIRDGVRYNFEKSRM